MSVVRAAVARSQGLPGCASSTRPAAKRFSHKQRLQLDVCMMTTKMILNQPWPTWSGETTKSSCITSMCSAWRSLPACMVVSCHDESECPSQRRSPAYLSDLRCASEGQGKKRQLFDFGTLYRRSSQGFRTEDNAIKRPLCMVDFVDYFENRAPSYLRSSTAKMHVGLNA